MWGVPKVLRATRIEHPSGMRSWPMPVEDLDEEDGGTFYRPAPPNWHNGSGAPGTKLGDEGDHYLDTSKDPPEWYGPKGEEDEDGNGDWGSPNPLPDAGDGTWIKGTGDPDNENDGDDGDYYLDTSAHCWWGPKAAGVWTDTGPNWIKAAWIIFEPIRPRTSGIFEIPANMLGTGDSESEDTIEAHAYLILAGEDSKPIITLHAACVTAKGGEAVKSDLSDLMVILTGNKEIFKARWRITGGKNLKWSGSGGLTQLV